MRLRSAPRASEVTDDNTQFGIASQSVALPLNSGESEAGFGWKNAIRSEITLVQEEIQPSGVSFEDELQPCSVGGRSEL